MKTASMALLSLAFVACNAQNPSDVGADVADADLLSESLPVDQAAPPTAMDLKIEGQLIQGTRLTFTITGAAPNSDVFIARGVDFLDAPAPGQPGVACPQLIGGSCLQISRPQVLAGPALGGVAAPFPALRANANGVATLTIPSFPVNLPVGTVIWFQALAPNRLSDAVGKSNPYSTAANPTGNGLFRILILEDATVAPGNYAGVRDEIYYSALTGLDICSIEYNVRGTGLGPLPACPGCDFAFATQTSGFTEISESGDCLDMLGVDVSTLTGSNGSIGYDADYYFSGYGNYPVAMAYDTTGATWVPQGFASFSAGAFFWYGEAPGYGYAYIY